MKKAIVILVTMISLASCKRNNENLVSSENNLVTKTEESVKPLPKKATENSNVLCQINGKNWAYTKASGIVSKHPKTGKRTAIITFKKKLEKGSESIQLRYDADSYELESASVQLKFKKEGGKLFTCFYDLHPDTRDRNPESELFGSIDLSNSSSASGIAELKNLNIKYGKEALQNIEDAIITVSGLKFTGVGYSDLDRLYKK